MTFLDQPRQSDEVTSSAATASEIVSGLLLAASAAGIAIYTHVQNLINQARGDVITETFDSSCIYMLEYDKQTGQMIVTFTDGSVYDYPYVAPSEFVRFTSASSKGTFFNAEVRGRW